MSYRPICDFWWLARCKYKGGVKRYGGYLGGFPERARALLGIGFEEPLLHVCGGLAHLYPYKRGFGPNDKRLDLDESVKPDYLASALEPYPDGPWPAALLDPPYSPKDSLRYAISDYPNPNELLKVGINSVESYGRVGMIHYVIPKCPSNAVFMASVGIACGFNNRIRVYTVFERKPFRTIFVRKGRVS